MKVLVCGSRSIKDYEYVKQCILESRYHITTLIEGEAYGVDKLARKYAEKHSIPVDPHPAQWELYGKAAGFIRNKEMVDKADAVIVIWDGKSSGTKDSMDYAKKKDKPLFIKIRIMK